MSFALAGVAVKDNIGVFTGAHMLRVRAVPWVFTDLGGSVMIDM